MRQQITSKTGTGSSSTLTMDTYISPFNVGFGVVVSGDPTYTVQHSFDNPFNTGGVVTWYSHPTIAAQTTNKDGNYAFPVSAIKLIVTAGTGTATLTVIQAGVVGG